MIITQTPFRMSFFGGGTDMENFFRLIQSVLCVLLKENHYLYPDIE